MKKIWTDVILPFGVAIVGFIIAMSIFVYCGKTSTTNTETIYKVPTVVTRTDSIKTQYKDSIKTIKVIEKYEIQKIYDANNDSTYAIFKRLVSE